MYTAFKLSVLQAIALVTSTLYALYTYYTDTDTDQDTDTETDTDTLTQTQTSTQAQTQDTDTHTCVARDCARNLHLAVRQIRPRAHAGKIRCYTRIHCGRRALRDRLVVDKRKDQRIEPACLLSPELGLNDARVHCKRRDLVSTLTQESRVERLSKQ